VFTSRARVDVRVETRHTRKKTKLNCYNAVVAAGLLGNASDVNVEHNCHPQPASGGAQPHVKRVDARAGIMEIAIGKAF
jgi:hypothetical protein